MTKIYDGHFDIDIHPYAFQLQIFFSDDGELKWLMDFTLNIIVF